MIMNIIAIRLYCSGSCVNISFHFTWIDYKKHIGSCGEMILSFMGNCKTSNMAALVVMDKPASSAGR